MHFQHLRGHPESMGSSSESPTRASLLSFLARLVLLGEEQGSDLLPARCGVPDGEREACVYSDVGVFYISTFPVSPACGSRPVSPTVLMLTVSGLCPASPETPVLGLPGVLVCLGQGAGGCVLCKHLGGG